MKYVLPIIVISQFFCTSLWFAGNSVITEIAVALQLNQNYLAHLTSSIQFGFIAGTLIFAILTISDRFSPSLVFFCSAILAGLFNLGICINNINAFEMLAFRFLTGFFLAGIYPVGMKIASDYYKTGLGKSLGFLVGALVFGTAFPHLLKDISTNLPWKYVLYSTTLFSFIGGISILLFVPNGPYRKLGQKIKFSTFLNGFRDKNFRAVSFGYFGHMWELYSFWTFVPIMLTSYATHHLETNLNISLLSFLIIASGGLACFASGVLSQYFGVKKIATLALTISGLCCIFSPVFITSKSTFLFIGFLFIWGLAVIADSPLFSTLVAQNAPEESRGSSLTIVNCIGFSITIISIQFINFISERINEQFIYMFLAIGPILGLTALYRTKNKPI